MEHFEALRREFDRVSIFTCFDSSQRVWWIYLRNAALEVAAREDLPELTGACDLVTAVPESLTDEPLRWHQLRAAVDRVLAADH